MESRSDTFAPIPVRVIDACEVRADTCGWAVWLVSVSSGHGPRLSFRKVNALPSGPATAGGPRHLSGRLSGGPARGDAAEGPQCDSDLVDEGWALGIAWAMFLALLAVLGYTVLRRRS